MALEYKLPYTAEDISNRLGNVTVNAENITKLENNLNSANENIADLMLNKVQKTRTVNGKTLETDIVLTPADINADAQGSAASALDQAKAYIDTKVSAEKADRETGDTNILNTAQLYTDAQVKIEKEAREAGVNDALIAAKTYTDEETAARNDAISAHNISTGAHNDIRNLVTELQTKVMALLDSDDETLDQMSEVVTYIKNNKNLIDSITTSKVNVSDIIDNLTSTIANKPLSANQGKVLKTLIDTLQTTVDGKSNVGHTHNYAGSDSIGGSGSSGVSGVSGSSSMITLSKIMPELST